MLKKFLFIVLLPLYANSQTLRGYVYDYQDNRKNPLPGVNIYLIDRSTGTISNKDGYFELHIPPENNLRKVVFSYIGYEADTIEVKNIDTPIEVVLSLGVQLNEVIISENLPGTYILRLEPIKVHRITTGELQRAACCNLSESFETDPSVDVHYSDAVSGAKQIQLLGLSGLYTQILFENMPYLRGLGIPYGLEYLPGQWMESIYVSKGTSSVVNGYESITGQINVELKKPEQNEKTFVNIYADNSHRTEANFNQRIVFNEDFQTIIFGHLQNNYGKNDHNEDGFLDEPLIKQIHLANHYNFHSDRTGFETRFGFRGLAEQRQGGQIKYYLDTENNQNFYLTNINTRRIEGFTKTGYLFKNKHNSNIGFINSVSLHDMNSTFGLKQYEAKQLGYYSNLIFNSNLFNEKHTLHTGFSFMYDNYDEKLNKTQIRTQENVPGFFAQYTFQNYKNLTTIGGIRLDYHNIHKLFITPRFHLKYNITEDLTLRTSIGKGYRSPRIIAENPRLLATSREIIFETHHTFEEALNYGSNLTWNFHIKDLPSTMSFEAYRTNFINQVVVDIEKDANSIYVYNLKGKSYASHFQYEISSFLNKQLEVRWALRYNDVKTTYSKGLQEKPLVNKWKSLLTSSYKTKNKKWQFDLTTIFNGKSRLPDLWFLPPEHQLPKYSPDYFLMNLHLTYNLKNISLYGGCENLLNFRQKHPILFADDPFGPYFDSSIIWGPIMGRKIYIGLRYKIDKPINHH